MFRPTLNFYSVLRQSPDIIFHLLKFQYICQTNKNLKIYITIIPLIIWVIIKCRLSVFDFRNGSSTRIWVSISDIIPVQWNNIKGIPV